MQKSNANITKFKQILKNFSQKHKFRNIFPHPPPYQKQITKNPTKARINTEKREQTERVGYGSSQSFQPATHPIEWII